MTAALSAIGASAIDRVNAGTATRTSANARMDQSDFLRLMTTQLTTQDPFNPMDNTQMVAQMAQFSQVAGIGEMNASLKAMAAGSAGASGGGGTDLAGWIGRSVLVDSDVAPRLADGSYAGEAMLAGPADAVTVEYLDAGGRIVHSDMLGARPAGAMAFRWAGDGAAGDALAVRVTARQGAAAVAAPTAAWAGVTSIRLPGGGAQSRLVTAIGDFPASAAVRLA